MVDKTLEIKRMEDIASSFYENDNTVGAPIEDDKLWISKESFQNLIDKIGSNAVKNNNSHNVMINKDFYKGVLSTIEDFQKELDKP